MDKLASTSGLDIKVGRAMGRRADAPIGTGTRLWRFLRHFLEMQVTMGLGALVCYLLGLLISTSSIYATVYHPGTYLFTIGDVLFLAVPVVAWMVFRGHGWRHSLEMAAAMVAPVTAIIVLGQLAAYDYLTWLITGGYPAMSLGMIGYMLYRHQTFTTGHAGCHNTRSAHAETITHTANVRETD